MLFNSRKRALKTITSTLGILAVVGALATLAGTQDIGTKRTLTFE